MGELTIKQKVLVDDFSDDISAVFLKGEIDAVILKLEDVGNDPERHVYYNMLYRMLEGSNIEFERGRDLDYYKNLVNKSQSHFPTFKEFQDRLLLEIMEIYERFPNPEMYMEKLVNYLEKPEDNQKWEKDSLRLRILKQFIKYTNSLKGTRTGEPYIKAYVQKKMGISTKIGNDYVAENIDEGIFDILLTATKEEIKTKYQVLQMSDDLAKGGFKLGATRENLYLFAIAFNMTLAIGDKAIRIETDIEKKLFEDYYQNNFMLYLEQFYLENRAAYTMPNGQGINWKNYVDVIYCYWISQDNLTPLEKFKGVKKMLKFVEDTASTGNIPQNAFYPRTIVYKKDTSEKILLAKGSKDFETYIINKYDTNRRTVNNTLGGISLKPEQKTAFEEYKKIIEELDVELSFASELLENCNYGLWFTEIESFTKDKHREEYFNDLISRNHLQESEFKQFLVVLKHINDLVEKEFHANGGLPSQDNYENKEDYFNDLFRKLAKSEDTITRMDLIIAYYYYYNQRKQNENLDNRLNMKSFRDVYDEFKEGVDEYLEEAFYQPFSEKNIFDVLIAFSAYTYLYN